VSGGAAIGGHTRLAGVIGWPITHSRSPAIHNAAYAAVGLDAAYVPLPVPPGKLADAFAGLRAFGFMGANVTVPYKQDALALCDELDEVALTAGAVNTLRVDERGRISGWNTDVAGYADGLEEAGVARGTPALVLGAGGAARSVVLALARRGHAVLVIARNPAHAASLLALGAADVRPWTQAALSRGVRSASLLVDATSAALEPNVEPEMLASLPIDRLGEGCFVSSLVYHREPALLAAARARGLRTQDGAAMLVHQAARAFTLMTGNAAPLEVMRAAFTASLAEPKPGPEKTNAPH
jgi:shikimate dehydrogenase